MLDEIKTITLPLPFKMGSVNCYLITTDSGTILIDTGASTQRAALEKELDHAGCRPGNLKLIILTHGDFDHTSNAAYLRDKFETKIAMHEGDAGMIEHGDMFLNRGKINILIRKMIPFLFGFGKSERCKPDLLLEDSFNLSSVGLDATVLSLPGHSKGSLGILTGSGDLFCGDLLENVKQPSPNSLVDDSVTMAASIEKLSHLTINTVYPGHGKPFQMELFMSNYR